MVDIFGVRSVSDLLVYTLVELREEIDVIELTKNRMLRTEREELEHKFRRPDISQDTDCVMDATKRFLLTFSEQCKFRLVFLSQRPCARSQLNPAVENNAGEQTARA